MDGVPDLLALSVMAAAVGTVMLVALPEAFRDEGVELLFKDWANTAGR